jgi:hypothetical protein
MFASPTGLDQTSMTQERKVVADGGLTLSAEVSAKLSHISLFLTEKHQYL